MPQTLNKFLASTRYSEGIYHMHLQILSVFLYPKPHHGCVCKYWQAAEIWGLQGYGLLKMLKKAENSKYYLGVENSRSSNCQGSTVDIEMLDKEWCQCLSRVKNAVLMIAEIKGHSLSSMKVETLWRHIIRLTKGEGTVKLTRKRKERTLGEKTSKSTNACPSILQSVTRSAPVRRTHMVSVPFP